MGRTWYGSIFQIPTPKFKMFEAGTLSHSHVSPVGISPTSLFPSSFPPQVVSGLPSDRANQYSPSLSRTANIQKPFLFPFLLRSSVKDKLNKPLAEWQGAAAAGVGRKRTDKAAPKPHSRMLERTEREKAGSNGRKLVVIQKLSRSSDRIHRRGI